MHKNYDVKKLERLLRETKHKIAELEEVIDLVANPLEGDYTIDYLNTKEINTAIKRIDSRNTLDIDNGTLKIFSCATHYTYDIQYQDVITYSNLIGHLFGVKRQVLINGEYVLERVEPTSLVENEDYDFPF